MCAVDLLHALRRDKLVGDVFVLLLREYTVVSGREDIERDRYVSSPHNAFLQIYHADIHVASALDFPPSANTARLCVCVTVRVDVISSSRMYCSSSEASVAPCCQRRHGRTFLHSVLHATDETLSLAWRSDRLLAGTFLFDFESDVVVFA